MASDDSKSVNGSASTRGALERRPLVDAAIIAVLLAAGAAVLLYNLGLRPLAQHESTSWFIAQLELPALLEALWSSELNAGLYYLSLHFWLGVGQSETTIRVLSVIFGAVTVPGVYLIGAHLFGRLAGVVAGVLLAGNLFFVRQGQEARGYALSILLVTLAAYLLLLTLRGRKGVWPWYGVIGALAMYAHFFAGLVIGAHLLSLLFLARREVPVRSLAKAYGLMALLVTPIAVFTATNDKGQVDWIHKPTLRRLLGGIREFTGGNGTLLMILHGLFFIGLCALLVWSLRRHGRSWKTWSYGFILLWLVVPLIISFGISYIKPVFVARYLIISFPALTLSVGAVVDSVAWKPVTLAGAFAALVLAVQVLPDHYSEEGLQWQTVTEKIVARSQSGDGIVVYAPTVMRPYLYHLERLGARSQAPEPVYPSYSWSGFSQTRYSPNYGRIAEKVSSLRRVWLLQGYANDRPRRKEGRRMEQMLMRACGPPQTGSRYRLSLFVCDPQS